MWKLNRQRVSRGRSVTAEPLSKFWVRCHILGVGGARHLRYVTLTDRDQYWPTHDRPPQNWVVRSHVTPLKFHK